MNRQKQTELPFQMFTDSTIYILAPAGTASGGQEALHQLAYYLISEGFTAQMAYYGSGETRVHPRYVQYSIPCCTISEIIDSKQNILISPESVTHFLSHFLHIRKAIWWLSVGFYRSSIRDLNWLRLLTDFLQGKTERLKEKLPRRNRVYRFDNDSVLNFTASHYAYDFVQKRGGTPSFLIEPLGIEFIQRVINSEPADLSGSNRKNQILYNPVKKSTAMTKLMKKFPHHVYIPLTGLTAEQLTNLMNESKLYVDFGKFPGPERLPKEAAVCGCCILTGTRGASAFHGDVPIPQQCKLATSSIKNINNRISEMLDTYSTSIDLFQEYREMTYNLESQFRTQIHSLFVKTNQPSPSPSRDIP